MLPGQCGVVSSRTVVTGKSPILYDQQSCEELVKDYVQQEAGRPLAINPCKEVLHQKRMGTEELLVRASHDQLCQLCWTRRGVKTSTEFSAVEATGCCGW